MHYSCIFSDRKINHNRNPSEFKAYIMIITSSQDFPRFFASNADHIDNITIKINHTGSKELPNNRVPLSIIKRSILFIHTPKY